VASADGAQMLHHPVRSPVLPKLRRTQRGRIAVFNTEQYFVSILLGSAFTERGGRARAHRWARNLQRSRALRARGDLDLAPRPTVDRAVDAAVDASKRAGVITHSARLSTLVDASVAAGFGALGAFVLVGWPGLAITVPAYAASRWSDLSRAIVEPPIVRSVRLRNLATAWAGRIERSWATESLAAGAPGRQ
jgi:hypothetical protein